jgi:hypothetical protein
MLYTTVGRRAVCGFLAWCLVVLVVWGSFRFRASSRFGFQIYMPRVLSSFFVLFFFLFFFAR